MAKEKQLLMFLEPDYTNGRKVRESIKHHLETSSWIVKAVTDLDLGEKLPAAIVAYVERGGATRQHVGQAITMAQAKLVPVAYLSPDVSHPPVGMSERDAAIKINGAENITRVDNIVRKSVIPWLPSP